MCVWVYVYFCDPEDKLFWAPLSSYSPSSFLSPLLFVICLLITVFAFLFFAVTLPLMSLGSVLPSPLPPSSFFLFSVSSPSAVSIEAPLLVLYLRLTSCVLKLHSLLWGRAEWIEGLTVRKPIPAFGLIEHISLLLSSPALLSSVLSLCCDQSRLLRLLLLAALTVSDGLLFLRNMCSSTEREHNQSTDWIIWHNFQWNYKHSEF